MNSNSSAIYVGRVSHVRQSDPPHGFSYSLHMMYLDLEELPQLFDGAWLWSARRMAPAWFRRKDYFDGSERPLAEAIREFVETGTGQRPRGPIRLLTHLRYLGHCFNPLSLYYCHDENDSLQAVVAEVSNTPWGERHSYLLQPQSTSDPLMTDEHPKTFHVSPFLPMDMDYRWRLNTPTRRLSVNIQAFQQDHRLFSATLAMKRLPFTNQNLRRVLTTQPVATAKVSAAIYYQAMKLLFKRARLYPHPTGDDSRT
jgi:DUF1365 family protein